MVSGTDSTDGNLINDGKWKRFYRLALVEMIVGSRWTVESSLWMESERNDKM